MLLSYRMLHLLVDSHFPKIISELDCTLGLTVTGLFVYLRALSPNSQNPVIKISEEMRTLRTARHREDRQRLHHVPVVSVNPAHTATLCCRSGHGRRGPARTAVRAFTQGLRRLAALTCTQMGYLLTSHSAGCFPFRNPSSCPLGPTP